MEVIKIVNASKEFQGVTVLDSINVSFNQGTIYGLIGRNGSGKSMLMKCICGFVPLSAGDIYINNRKVGKTGDSTTGIGILIESPGFLPYYSGLQNLKFLADISNSASLEQIKHSIKSVGLDPDSKKKVGKYSLGMKQRLGIAQAIMEDPDILLLDEPFNGLDNKGVQEMREFFKSLKKENKTIIIASHSEEDISILCDNVYQMDRGKIEQLR